MQLIRLVCEGPFSLTTQTDRLAFKAPNKRGIFLLVTGGPDARRIAYVGQARDLREGILGRMSDLLGGRLPLYDPDSLRSGIHSEVYSGKRKAFLAEFLEDHQRLARLAHANVLAYEIFWARVPHKRGVREAAQSALIEHVKSLGMPLQNESTPRAREKTERTLIESVLPAGVEILGHATELHYGVRALPTPSSETELPRVEPEP